MQAAIVLGCLILVFSAIAPEYVSRYRLSWESAAGIYFCFVSLLMLAIVPGLQDTREWIRARLPRWGLLPVAFAALWCVPYLFYAWGTRDFQAGALLRLFVVGAILPGCYVLFPVRDVTRLSWQDSFVAAVLIASLMSHQLRDIWNVPRNLDFLGRLFLIVAGAWTWIYIRRVPELGYSFLIGLRTLGISFLCFLGFAVLGLPLGLALHFIAWNPQWVSAWSFAESFIEILLFIALLEELFFRGFLQTLLANNLRSGRASLAAVSCVFGLFHILHAPFPNWPYVILATIAGFFYGIAFLKSGNLIGAALTHALVDTVWRTFFTARH